MVLPLSEDESMKHRFWMLGEIPAKATYLGCNFLQAEIYFFTAYSLRKKYSLTMKHHRLHITWHLHSILYTQQRPKLLCCIVYPIGAVSLPDTALFSWNYYEHALNCPENLHFNLDEAISPLKVSYLLRLEFSPAASSESMPYSLPELKPISILLFPSEKISSRSLNKTSENPGWHYM